MHNDTQMNTKFINKIHYDKNNKPTRKHGVMFETEWLNVIIIQCEKLWNKKKWYKATKIYHL